MSLKKSLFNALTSAEEDATFDFVQNGTNYKITKSDLVALFGTTGSLAQEGDVTGIATLHQSGDVNYIRNLIGGAGIAASLSAAGGIQLSHSFVSGADGVPVFTGLTENTPLIRSLVAGPGVSLSVADRSVQISASDTPVSTKTVLVNTMSDFPAPSSGVITLAASTAYYVTNDLTTSSRFVLSDDTVLMATDGTLINLEYTGTDTMLTSENASVKVRDISLSCEDGQLLDITDDGTHLFQMSNIRVPVCDTIGSVEGVQVANFQSMLWEDIVTDGISFAGLNTVINFEANVGNLNGGTFIDMGTSTTLGFSIESSFGILAAGTTFLSGAADSANIIPGGLGTILNTRAQGSGVPLNGVSEEDSLWQFLLNNGIADSRDTALMSNSGVTVAVLSTNTPVKVSSNWVEQEVNHFTTDSTGKITYTGKGTHVTLHATVTARMSSGTDDCSFYFALNGSIITDSAILREFKDDPGNIGMLWGLSLSTGDYIEIWAENHDTTVDIVVENLIIRID